MTTNPTKPSWTVGKSTPGIAAISGKNIVFSRVVSFKHILSLEAKTLSLSVKKLTSLT